MSDTLITVVGILFILSVINEKLTQLVRSYPTQSRNLAFVVSGWIFLAILSSWIDPSKTEQDLRPFDLFLLTVCNTLLVFFLAINTWRSEIKKWKKGVWVKALVVLDNVSPDKFEINREEETVKQKEKVKQEEKIKEISVLSVLLGFLVAYLFDASLFNLFKKDFTMGWTVSPFIGSDSNILWPKLSREFLGFDAQRALGFVITGFFLSFGSAFFHDLLDLLFAAKKARERLKDFDPRQLSSADQVSTLANYSAEDIAKAAVLQNEAYFVSKLGDDYQFATDSVILDERGIKKPIVYLNIKGEETKGILPEVKADLGNGVEVKVPVKCITGLGEPQLHLSSGDTIANNPESSMEGTICCAVQKLGEPNKQFFLTCGHVISSEFLCDGGKTGEKVYSNDSEIGNVATCFFKNDIDYSLIESNHSQPITNSNMSPNAILIEDAFKNKEVTIKGRSETSKRPGYIISLNRPLTFTDRDKNLVKFNNLVVISASTNPSNYNTISEGGDSGSAVVINDSKLIAMVIGGDTKYTYALPLRPIFSKEKITTI